MNRQRQFHPSQSLITQPAAASVIIVPATPRNARPRWLRNQWLAVGLVGLVLCAYELVALWSAPWWTAWLIIASFAARP